MLSRTENGSQFGLARAAGLIIVMAVLAAGGAMARAQEASPQKRDAQAMDVHDLLRKLFHKTVQEVAAERPIVPMKLMLNWTPFITGNSSNGFGLGAAGNAAFYAGDPETTKISAAVPSVSLTTKAKIFLYLQGSYYSRDNEWHVDADNRLNLTSETTYGLGTNTAPGAGVNTKYNLFRVYDTAYHQVLPGLYLGGGFLFNARTAIRPGADEEAVWPESPFVTYSEQNGFKLTSQNSAGVSVNALYDTRDNFITPSRGFYANGNYRFFFEGFLGGASSWQEFIGDLRTYARLGGSERHILAFWLYGDFVTRGTAPYFDLPATSTDTYGHTGRGYLIGRFRGEDMAYGEAEYRWTVTRNGLFGMVAFLNTETLSDRQRGERLFDSFATGYGFGLRLRFDKKSKTNLTADFGWGKSGSFGFYLGVQEAY